MCQHSTGNVGIVSVNLGMVSGILSTVLGIWYSTGNLGILVQYWEFWDSICETWYSTRNLGIVYVKLDIVLGILV